MKRLWIALAIGLGGCAEASRPPIENYGPVPALDQRGLPVTFSACARERSIASTSFYNVYLDCHTHLIRYVSALPKLSPTEKGTSLDYLEKEGMTLSQREFEARHGWIKEPKQQPAEPEPFVIGAPQKLPGLDRRL